MTDHDLIPRKGHHGIERFRSAVSVVLHQHWDPSVHAQLLERMHRDVWYKYVEKKLPFWGSSPSLVITAHIRQLLLAVGGDLIKNYSPGEVPFLESKQGNTLLFDVEASANFKTSSGDL